jgi:predicted nucleic acid-binding protein
VRDTNIALSELVYLVTGDRNLLSLAGESSCPIVTAGQFLNALI